MGDGMNDGLLSRARARLEREVLEIEHRTDLTDDQKADRIVVIFSTICAGVAVQPIPFADFFILTPLQAFMGTRLAAIRGVRLSEQESTDILKQLMGVVGMGLLAQQLGIAAAKILFPIFGGVATVPVVFGLTYAIGTVMDKFFLAKAAGRKLSDEEIKDIWKKAKRKGREEGKQREASIKDETL
jgi:uncharacterized protein (DUF697 family)